MMKIPHGKQKFKLKDSCKKGNHEWYPSRWLIKGVQKTATEFYCKFCLLTADQGEKEIQAREALNAQPDLPTQEQGT